MAETLGQALQNVLAMQLKRQAPAQLNGISPFDPGDGLSMQMAGGMVSPQAELYSAAASPRDLRSRLPADWGAGMNYRRQF